MADEGCGTDDLVYTKHTSLTFNMFPHHSNRAFTLIVVKRFKDKRLLSLKLRYVFESDKTSFSAAQSLRRGRGGVTLVFKMRRISRISLRDRAQDCARACDLESYWRLPPVRGRLSLDPTSSIHQTVEKSPSMTTKNLPFL
jgi:hypothetical protein